MEGNSIPGLLRFSSVEGGRIELMGFLPDAPETPGWSKVEPRLDIILGRSERGERITLFKNSRASRGVRLETGHSSFYVKFIFIGEHFLNEDEINFDSFTAYYSEIDNWFDFYGFKTSTDGRELRYKEPNPVEFRIRDDYQIKIYSSIEYNISPADRQYEYRERIPVDIISDKRRSFFDFLTIVSKFNSFISFALMKQNYLTNLIARTKAGKEISASDYSRNNVRVYFLQERISLPSARNRFLFTLSDIEAKIQLYVGNWFERLDELGPFFSLFFSIVKPSDLAIENKFLNCIQAIEGYHRIRNPIGPEVLAAHEKRVTEIAEKSPEYKNWIKYKLENLYGPSLFERLEDIINNYIPKNYDDLVFKEIECKKDLFIRQTVIIRNNLIHLDSKKKPVTLDIKYCVRVLRRLLILVLLRECGFEFDKIKRKFDTNINIAIRDPDIW